MTPFTEPFEPPNGQENTSAPVEPNTVVIPSNIWPWFIASIAAVSLAIQTWSLLESLKAGKLHSDISAAKAEWDSQKDNREKVIAQWNSIEHQKQTSVEQLTTQQLNLSSQVTSLKAQHEQLQKDHEQLQADHEQVAQSTSSLTKSRDDLKKTNEALAQEHTSLETSIASATKQQKTLESEEHNLKELIRRKTDELTQLTQLVTNKVDKSTALQAALDKLKTEQTTLNVNIDALQTKHSKLTLRLDKTTKELATLDNDKQQLNEELATVTAALADQRNKEHETVKRLNEATRLLSASVTTSTNKIETFSKTASEMMKSMAETARALRKDLDSIKIPNAAPAKEKAKGNGQ